MPIPNEPSYETLRLRANLAQLTFELRFLKLRLKAGFDPNQPRVPPGHSDGGQWTRIGAGPGVGLGGGADQVTASGGDRTRGDKDVAERVFTDRTGRETWRTYVERYRSDGSVKSRTILNRDGSRITSEFGPAGASGTNQRNTVTLADGSRFVFENSGTTQRIYDRDGKLIGESVWTPDGPEPQPIVQPVAMTLEQEHRLVEAGRTLYDWLSSQNTKEQRACYAFVAREYRPEKPSSGPLIFVGPLYREDVESACRKLDKVQTITDSAYSKALGERPEWRATDLGTRIHKLVADEINGPLVAMPPANHSRSYKDPNFVAEFSFLKSQAAKYGRLGSIRVDVLENAGNNTVCVYDLKTGESGLLPGRSQELAKAVRSHYGPANRIIVTEVRPQR